MEKLAYNLAKRDALKEFEEQEEVDSEKIFEKIVEIEEKYNDEFYENGLRNIRIEKNVCYENCKNTGYHWNFLFSISISFSADTFCIATFRRE